MRVIFQVSRSAPAILTVLLTLGFTGACQASLTEIGTYSGTGKNAESGDTVSGSVTFYYDTSTPNTLTIKLYNTSASVTSRPADVLVGLAFTFNNVSPTFTNASASQGQLFSPTAILGSTLPNTTTLADFANRWKYQNNRGGNSNVTGTFGVTTNGFSGAFNGNGLNNMNYGLIAPGSTITNNSPYALNGLQFTLTSTTNVDFSKAGFSNLQFLFGTDGSGTIPGGPVNSVPEPSSLAIAAVGALGFLGYGLRRRVAK